MPTPTLVLLLADSDYTFFNLEQDGVQKAEINKIAAQVYVAEDQVGDFVERMIAEHFGGYLIPSEYEGEIVYSEEILNNEDLLPEYPKDFNWGFIEDCLPNYHRDTSVSDSDLFQRYVDGELDDGEEGREEDLEYVERDCPAYLTKKEWAFHQLTDVDIDLFQRASEHKFN